MTINELDSIRHNRHAARLIAILSLYSYNMSEDTSANLLKISEKMKKSYRNQDIFDIEVTMELHVPDEEFLERLVNLTLSKQNEIEELIRSCLIAKWNFDKLDQVLRAILKLSALELLYHGEIPAKIIIDEYVSLTKTFYENNEAGFVNKVIDTMASKVRAEEMPSL